MFQPLIRHKNIINHIKAQRLSWFGHLHQMPEEIMVKRVCKWKPMLTRPLGRPKNRWEDDIINYMKKLKIKDWLAASTIAISGNYVLRRSKHSKNEAVAPKEEEDSVSRIWKQDLWLLVYKCAWLICNDCCFSSVNGLLEKLILQVLL